MGKVRFGWAWDGHEAINKQAFEVMRPSGLKAFVAQNQGDILEISNEQDRYHRGPHHYLNAEKLWKNPPEVPRWKVFSQVHRFFSQEPNLRRKFREHMDEYQKNCCDSPDNVLEKTRKNYEELVKELKALNHASSKSEKEDVESAIKATIGQLTHYVGDMNQPMHTSAYHTWRLPVIRKDAHRFMEKNLFSQQEHHQWRRETGQKLRDSGFQTRLMKGDEVTGALQRSITAAYAQMPKLVELTDQARRSVGPPRDDSQYSNRDRGKVKNTLVDNWKPVASEQMESATTLMASLLDSAYEEAGRPRFDAQA